MNDLELVVGKCELNKEGEVAFVKKAFEISERDGHLVWRRRDKDGAFQRVPADPHRARAQFAGETMLAANAREESLVHLAEQPNRHGKPVADALDAVLHCEHVVLHLLRVFGLVAWRALAGLLRNTFGFSGRLELLDVGLGPFDPGAEHRFQS